MHSDADYNTKLVSDRTKYLREFSNACFVLVEIWIFIAFQHFFFLFNVLNCMIHHKLAFTVELHADELGIVDVTKNKRSSSLHVAISHLYFPHPKQKNIKRTAPGIKSSQTLCSALSALSPSSSCPHPLLCFLSSWSGTGDPPCGEWWALHHHAQCLGCWIHNKQPNTRLHVSCWGDDDTLTQTSASWSHAVTSLPPPTILSSLAYLLSFSLTLLLSLSKGHVAGI